MYDYYLKKRHSAFAVWFPYDIDTNSVIIGKSIVAEHPPGIEAGYFWIDAGLKTHILLEATVAAEYERRNGHAPRGEEE